MPRQSVALFLSPCIHAIVLFIYDTYTIICINVLIFNNYYLFFSDRYVKTANSVVLDYAVSIQVCTKYTKKISTEFT